MPVLKYSGNVFRCYCCSKCQLVEGKDVWHLVQIRTDDAHYYLVCDPCYPAFSQTQMNAAMERLEEVNREIAQPKPGKPKPVM